MAGKGVAMDASQCTPTKSLTHLLRYLRWVLKCDGTAWHSKIRLLCHAAPQQQDFERQALPPSSLSNLITSSRDGICTYFVPFQSLISSEGSVSPWLDFVSLSCGYIYNTSISCETSAQKIKHKKQLAKAVCDQEYSRLSFSHKNKFITLAAVTALTAPNPVQPFTRLSTFGRYWTKSKREFSITE